MALYSSALSTIRQYLSAAVGDLIESTAGGTPTSTTYVDTKLRQADDYYNNHKYKGYCYYGTAIGQEREVKDWTLTSPANTLTLDPAFSPAIAVGDKFELHRIFTEDELRKAINLAIESLADGKYLIDKIDASTVLVADTYEYTLPTDMSYVHKITTEETAGGDKFPAWAEIDPRNWMLISPRKVKLHESYYSVSAGKDLRIEGQGRQATLTTDTGVCYLPPHLIIAEAILRLPQSKIESNKLGGVYAQARLNADYYRRTERNYPHPQARRVVE